MIRSSHLLAGLTWLALALTASPVNARPPQVAVSQADADDSGPPAEASRQGSSAASTSSDPAASDPGVSSVASASTGAGAAKASVRRPIWFLLALAVFVVSSIALVARLLLKARTGGAPVVSVVAPPDVSPPGPSPAVNAPRRRYVLVARSGASVTLDAAALASRNGFCLGRSEIFCDFLLAEDDVSRRHVRFSRNGDRLSVEDLNSSHGTRVNGRRLTAFQPTALDSGDRIRLGERHEFSLSWQET